MNSNLSRFIYLTTGTPTGSRLYVKLAALLLLALSPANLWADIVYVTARPQPSGAGANPDGTYAELGYAASDTSAKSAAAGAPARSGARYFNYGFTNEGCSAELSPTLAVPGGIYQIDYTFSSTAGNISADVLLGVRNTGGCTLSFSQTDKFQSQYGQSPASWQLLGFLTNDANSSMPIIDFYYLSGNINVAASQRLVIDCFRFTLVQPCLAVPVPTVSGPLATNLPTVQINGIISTATAVTIYQDTGSGMTRIGSLAVSNPSTNVAVPVTGLRFGAQVSASQTVAGQESCLQPTGVIVGGGANPNVRVALSIRSNPDLTGPVGSTAGGTNSNIYFLGASSVLSGACPEQGLVLYPSNEWQTVIFTRGPDTANPTDPVVLWNNGSSAPATLEGNFGALDGIAFACEGDPGNFELYLDDLGNGINGRVQDWEAGTLGATYAFVQPNVSGTTSGNLLTVPNESAVVTNVASSGTKSLRVRWQFADAQTNRWLRLVTATATPVQNPQLDLNEPISFKILLTVPKPLQPVQPGPLSISLSGGSIILNWTGSYPLQKATAVNSTFSDVGLTTGPASFTVGPGSVFYRLRSN